MAARIRLYVDQPLAQGQSVPVTQAQAHYLFAVMRLHVGATISLFNGQDGEWGAEVVRAAKRNGILTCTAQSRPHLPRPDLWLLFAPVKKQRISFIVEKACELGASRIIPVLTDYTNAERIRTDKMRLLVIEAAEQSGATDLPEITEPQKLRAVLDAWDATRPLWFCDEALAGAPLPPAPQAAPSGAVLIGPEGGFSPDERTRLCALSYTQSINLGPRILRADTAAVAALTLWLAHHAILGPAP